MGRGEEERTQSEVSTQHFSKPSCSLAHLPPQTRFSHLGDPFLLPPPKATQPPSSQFSRTLVRDAPPGGRDCPNPGPCGHRERHTPAADRRLSPGIRLPLRFRGWPATRPPAGPGRRPNSPSFPRSAPGRAPPPPATPGDSRQVPRSPLPPAGRPPPRFPGVPRRQHRPRCRSPGPGQSCVGETAQRERAGRGRRRERKGERAQHRLGLLHPLRRGNRRAGSTTARASHARRRRAPAAASALGEATTPRARARRAALPGAPAPPAPRSPAHLPSCGGLLLAPHPSRTPAPWPVARANGSAPLLHKREGRALVDTNFRGRRPLSPGALPLRRALSQRLLHPALGAT